MAYDEFVGYWRIKCLMIPFILAVFVTLLATSAAPAAPSCVDRNGDPLRCGVRPAIALAWNLPAAQPRRNELPLLDESGWTNLAKALGIVGVLLVGIALLPEFDGSDDASWDKQEGDDEQR